MHEDKVLLVLDTFKSLFKLEISNNVLFLKDEIIIDLANGTKAKIKAIKIA